MSLPTVKIAACHAAPVYLNPGATTDKALNLIDSAANAGANLVVFPEAFIPGFPFFAAALAPVDHGGRFSRYVAASIYADGPELAALRAKAAERGVVVSVGFSERSRASAGCVWNANLLIGEDGAVLAHHRKLCPTFWEKLVWSGGDGEGLRVGATERAGRVGALICGENTNPLARFALMAQEEHVHVASFPPAWPTTRGRAGAYQNRAANAVRGAAHAFEGKCFAVVCAGFLDDETKRIVADGDNDVLQVMNSATQATTQIFGPDGMQVGDELSEQEGLVIEDCDLNACVEAKRLHDVTGGYNNFSVFDLKVTRTRNEPVHFQ